MIWNLFKRFIKRLPGIRYVVEGRDQYIQLYDEMSCTKEQLECQLQELQSKLETQELKEATTALTNQKLMSECESLKKCIERKELELTGIEDVNLELKGEIELLTTRVANLQAENQQYKNTISTLQEEKRSYESRHLYESKLIVRLGQEGDNLQNELTKLETELFQKREELQQFSFRANTEALNSGVFWNNHYAQSGNSGTGSYNQLAQFKRDVVNAFLAQNDIVSVLEIGCGDGNQLQQIQYAEYTGVDVSPIITEKNREKFKEDRGKRFYCTLTERNQYATRTYDLTISMDVIFHLLEEEVFHQYMDDLFTLSEKFVVIYSSNHEEYTCWPEYRHRNFTGYVQEHYPDWELIKYIPNKYPYQIGKESETSASDFYIYKKML